jgi:LAGLIDADG endonuclease
LRSKTFFSNRFTQKDRVLLEQIKIYFNAGIISQHGSILHFRVESIKDLAKVIDHFYNYPLITKKYADYILFRKAYYILLNKEHLIKDGLEKFVGIKASINKGLSDYLKLAFPNVIASEKSMEIDYKIPNPQWLAGFATGEGCFFIKIYKSSNSKTRD